MKFRFKQVVDNLFELYFWPVQIEKLKNRMQFLAHSKHMVNSTNKPEPQGV